MADNDNAKPVNAGYEKMLDVIESHFRIVAIGFVSSNPHIPANMMWEAIASAMGGVISGATKGPDLAATMSARTHLSDVVGKAIRKKYPPMEMTPATVLQGSPH